MYDDGHQEGFQAKFHDRLQDALGGMRESVEAVCAKRWGPPFITTTARGSIAPMLADGRRAVRASASVRAR